VASIHRPADYESAVPIGFCDLYSDERPIVAIPRLKRRYRL